MSIKILLSKTYLLINLVKFINKVFKCQSFFTILHSMISILKLTLLNKLIKAWNDKNE